MKTILVPTDFSLPAYNAARYALKLARQLKTKVTLFNAFEVPVEAPMAAQVAWPLMGYTSIKKEITAQLENDIKKLLLEEQIDKSPNDEVLALGQVSEVGILIDVVRNIVEEQQAGLVVMGMYGSGALSQFFLGSNSRNMINKADFPLLLIPSKHIYKGLNKIAFATSLKEEDLEQINSLVIFARYFNAEIHLVYVCEEQENEQSLQERSSSFLREITSKINYPQIYYRQIKFEDIDTGLEWLAVHGMVDLLVMVHRRTDLLTRMFTGSHTQKMARKIDIPLMVFPSDVKVSF